ncbi:SMI1/KNR4 family protein [Sediminitomix flava]|uniref:Uncharacterized protein n=1 Tax=Sediminitomix flava TaxID=379075 RepID=A0A315YMG7_SEDFL|nr:SMI1/KNR4 family protein [Sediminitomix flava]PWJ28852.1 hypothetical protein BC781_1351 [Sediminitomix flava]
MEHLEKKFGVLYPERFKKFLKELDCSRVIIEMLDEKYEILPSLLEEITDNNIADTAYNNLNDLYTYPEDQQTKKLPFARNTTGDCYKFLYFQGENGTECGESIYVRDLDAPWAGRIKVSNSIEFLYGKQSKDDKEVLISCNSKTFNEFSELVDLPSNIQYELESPGDFGFNTKEANTPISVTTSLTISSNKDEKDDFCVIHVCIELDRGGKVLYGNYNYEIKSNKLLNLCFDENQNYRIYYYKFHAVMDALKKFKDRCLSNDLSIEELNEKINTSNYLNVIKGYFYSVDIMGNASLYGV